MSLQFDSIMTQYAKESCALWKAWRGKSQVDRVQAALSAIRRCTHFLPAVKYDTYLVADLGDYGVQYPSLWSIEINRHHAQEADLRLEDFLEWVTTPYHESRHAEQTYRIAQGVLAGDIALPGKSLATKMQSAMQGKSPREIAKAIESRNPFETTDQTTRRRIVQEWLDVPMKVIDHADMCRSYFKNFLQASTPPWFKGRSGDTIKNAVIDWMKASYDHHLGELDRKAQNQEQGWDRFYSKKGIPEEQDAYGIEGVVQGKILSMLGKSRTANAGDTAP
jgi:hypothetical protein